MIKDRFKTVRVDRSTVVWKDGMEISAYIAGVNSGVYGLPFVIEVKTWAKKWWFKEFFVRKITLNMDDVELLHDELSKVIDYFRPKKIGVSNDQA